MRWLRSIHAYAGLVLGILLAVFAISGGALVFKDDIWRLQYPELKQPLRELTSEDHAVAFQSAAMLLGGDVSAIMLPTAQVPAYLVYMSSGEALLSANSFTLIDNWRWYQSLTGILTEVHFRLLAGPTGKRLGGVVALLCVLMGISGVIIWWPGRRSFAVSKLLPRSAKRVDLLRMHRDLGVITVAALILFSTTAAGIIFYPTARAILNALFSDSLPVSAQKFTASDADLRMPDAIQIDAARNSLSAARLVAYYPPTGNRQVHYFRFKQDGERHPNGRSAVYVKLGAASVSQVIDATKQPAGERVAHWLYPLHAAKVGGSVYTLFATLSAILIAAIAVTGPVVFLKRTQRRKRVSDPTRE